MSEEIQIHQPKIIPSKLERERAFAPKPVALTAKQKREADEERRATAARNWPGTMATQRTLRAEAAAKAREQIKALLGDGEIDDDSAHALIWLAGELTRATDAGRIKIKEQHMKRPTYYPRDRLSIVPDASRIVLNYEPEVEPNKANTFTARLDGVDYTIIPGLNYIRGECPIHEIERVLARQIADEEITILAPGSEPPRTSKYLDAAREHAIQMHFVERE